MVNKGYDVPVLVLGFNRPDAIRQVFEALGKVKPQKIFLAVDGPRNEAEKEKVMEVRKVAKTIDWPCEVKTLFRDKNLGCLGAGVGAITWFFDNVEEGIILEDDAVATPDFFKFCKEMLEKYRTDERIMHVSGCNFQNGWQRDKYSYYFSGYTYMWGFAMWRRAWKKYDVKAATYPEVKQKEYLKDLYPNWLERRHMREIMDVAYYRNNDAGDTQWLYAVAVNRGLSIVPNRNLINYIGFRDDSAHTKKEDSFLYQPTKKMEFPLSHPPFVIKDRVSDERYVRWLLFNKIKKKLLIKTGLYRIFG